MILNEIDEWNSLVLSFYFSILFSSSISYCITQKRSRVALRASIVARRDVIKVKKQILLLLLLKVNILIFDYLHFVEGEKIKQTGLDA